MDERRIRQEDLFGQLPEEWGEELLPAIQAKVRAAGRKVVVLDDDPTGTQTVHGVPVLTDWPVEQLAEELGGPAPAVYLLTNSRSLPPPKAEELNVSVGEALRLAQARSGKDFAVVSRSDSTLRGHFPGEVAALARGLQPARGNEPRAKVFDAWLVAPCFPEGGRYTVNDVHYVAEGEWLVPAGQTEFARDKSFGYRSSNLREWAAEKTGGAVRAEEVAVISLEDLRLGGPAAVTEKLAGSSRQAGLLAPLNAAAIRQAGLLAPLDAAAFRQAGLLAGGNPLPCAWSTRSATATWRYWCWGCWRPRHLDGAFSAARRLLLSACEQGSHRGRCWLARTWAWRRDGAGLVVAGSYVPHTSAQLEALFNQTHIQPVEVQARRLLDEFNRDGEIARAREAVNRHLAAGEDAAVYTSRELVTAAAPPSAEAPGGTEAVAMPKRLEALKPT